MLPQYKKIWLEKLDAYELTVATVPQECLYGGTLHISVPEVKIFNRGGTEVFHRVCDKENLWINLEDGDIVQIFSE